MNDSLDFFSSRAVALQRYLDKKPWKVLSIPPAFFVMSSVSIASRTEAMLAASFLQSWDWSGFDDGVSQGD